MLGNPKSDPKLPPPIPPRAPAPRSAAPAPRNTALARARAFLEIRRMRLADLFRRATARVRRRPVVASVAAAAVLLVAAGGAAIALDVLPDVDLDLFAPKSLSEVRAEARARPSDASVQRDLGHALWGSKKLRSALRAYGRALSLDAGVADDRMITNLLALFGTRYQATAEALLWKNKVVRAAEGLEGLVKSKRHGVRWGAVRTLDRLGLGTKANWETAYIVDLDSSDCDVRREAVEKLGNIGTRRAVAALRDAREQDEKTGGWLRSRCLGERVDKAEQKILARR